MNMISKTWSEGLFVVLCLHFLTPCAELGTVNTETLASNIGLCSAYHINHVAMFMCVSKPITSPVETCCQSSSCNFVLFFLSFLLRSEATTRSLFTQYG